MAMSKCGSCGNHSFEIREAEPAGAQYKQIFVQCTACGVPVGVVDYINAGPLIETLRSQVSQIQTQMKALDDIDFRLRRIEKALG